MPADDDKDPLERLTHEDEARDSMQEAAEAAQAPHHDEAARRRAQEGADEAERQPRRQGEGLHPGMH